MVLFSFHASLTTKGANRETQISLNVALPEGVHQSVRNWKVHYIPGAMDSNKKNLSHMSLKVGRLWQLHGSCQSLLLKSHDLDLYCLTRRTHLPSSIRTADYTLYLAFYGFSYLKSWCPQHSSKSQYSQVLYSNKITFGVPFFLFQLSSPLLWLNYLTKSN